MIIISQKYTCEKSNWEPVEGIYLGFPYKVHHGIRYIEIPVNVAKTGASYCLACGKALCDRYHGEATDADVEKAEAALRGYAAAMVEFYCLCDKFDDLNKTIDAVECFLCDVMIDWDDIEPAEL